jgi:hypothetical protein
MTGQRVEPAAEPRDRGDPPPQGALERQFDFINICNQPQIDQGAVDGRNGHVCDQRHVSGIHLFHAMDDEIPLFADRKPL